MDIKTTFSDIFLKNDSRRTYSIATSPQLTKKKKMHGRSPVVYYRINFRSGISLLGRACGLKLMSAATSN